MKLAAGLYSLIDLWVDSAEYTRLRSVLMSSLDSAMYFLSVNMATPAASTSLPIANGSPVISSVFLRTGFDVIIYASLSPGTAKNFVVFRSTITFSYFDVRGMAELLSRSSTKSMYSSSTTMVMLLPSHILAINSKDSASIICDVVPLGFDINIISMSSDNFDIKSAMSRVKSSSSGVE